MRTHISAKKPTSSRTAAARLAGVVALAGLLGACAITPDEPAGFGAAGSAPVGGDPVLGLAAQPSPPLRKTPPAAMQDGPGTSLAPVFGFLFF